MSHIIEEEKTVTDHIRDMVSQLKEMQHYSRTNIEKLSDFWMRLDGEYKQPELAEAFGTLLNTQNAFEDQVNELIENTTIACNKMDMEG